MFNGAGLPTSLDEFIDGVVTDCLGPHSLLDGPPLNRHPFLDFHYFHGSLEHDPQFYLRSVVPSHSV